MVPEIPSFYFSIARKLFSKCKIWQFKFFTRF